MKYFIKIFFTGVVLGVGISTGNMLVEHVRNNPVKIRLVQEDNR